MPFPHWLVCQQVDANSPERGLPVKNTFIHFGSPSRTDWLKQLVDKSMFVTWGFTVFGSFWWRCSFCLICFATRLVALFALSLVAGHQLATEPWQRPRPCLHISLRKWAAPCPRQPRWGPWNVPESPGLWEKRESIHSSGGLWLRAEDGRWWFCYVLLGFYTKNVCNVCMLVLRDAWYSKDQA